MKKQLLSEELGRIKYLFNHERGVVISENNANSTDWNGKQRGMVNFLSPDLNVATNVKYEGQTYNMTTLTLLPKLEEVVTNSNNREIIPTLRELELTNDIFPYPDNMIGPKFDAYPEAQTLYNSFIESLVTFINGGGINNITSIKIQGTADSATPNTRIPRPYDSLDHNLVGDTVPYDGERDKKERNQYLADNRAKVLGQMIVTNVSASTGVDISSKIQYLPSINYYGEGEEKRGKKYRGVSVVPEYTPLQITQPGDELTGGSESKETIRKFVDLSMYGMDSELSAEVKNDLIAIKTLDFEKIAKDVPVYYKGALNNQQTPNGEIKNNELLVGGISFGAFIKIENDELNQFYDRRVDSNTKYVTIGKPVVVSKDSEYKYIKILRFALVRF